MASTAFSTTDLPLQEPTEPELTSKGKFVVWASVLSTLFLTQIAYNIGDFPVSMEFVCYGLIASYLLVSGHASLSIPSLILYLAAGASAVLTMKLTTAQASLASLLLLFALYAPFSFRLKAQPDLEAVQRYIQSTYVSAVTVIAAIAVVQLVLVNATGASALANIYFVLPEGIRGGGAYTFLREGGSIVKANGFFLRESADLSIVTALALLIEYFTRARWYILGILAAGLLSAVSGSGIIALMLGFLLPKRLTRVPMFVAASLGLILALYALYSADIPGLNSLFFDRLAEFEKPGTSGYARYVAPMEMIQRSLNDATTMWFGNGSGSYFRSTNLLQVTYEIADPTWAKLIFEYGFVGLILITALLVTRLYFSALPVQACNYLLFIWIINSTVLKVQYILVIWLLTIIPRTSRRSVPGQTLTRA